MTITHKQHKCTKQRDIPSSRHMATTTQHIYIDSAYIYIYIICVRTLACKLCYHVLEMYRAKAAHGLTSWLPTSWPLPGMFPGLLQLSYSGRGIAWWLSTDVPSAVVVPAFTLWTNSTLWCAALQATFSIIIARNKRGRSFVMVNEWNWPVACS